MCVYVHPSRSIDYFFGKSRWRGVLCFPSAKDCDYFYFSYAWRQILVYPVQKTTTISLSFLCGTGSQFYPVHGTTNYFYFEIEVVIVSDTGCVVPTHARKRQ